ncbi:MAG: hypothetical protein DA330_09775 [Nitrososphaera sp.]|nr:hypothetical protein [Nitrososphaera sp.]
MMDSALAAFSLVYSVIYQYLVDPVMSFAREFQFATICAIAILFIIFSALLMLRNAKRLPKAYVVEIFDVYGSKVSIDGVRQVFKTYDAAESYARMYRLNFKQYKFKVVGQEKDITKDLAWKG